MATATDGDDPSDYSSDNGNTGGEEDGVFIDSGSSEDGGCAGVSGVAPWWLLFAFGLLRRKAFSQSSAG